MSKSLLPWPRALKALSIWLSGARESIRGSRRAHREQDQAAADLDAVPAFPLLNDGPGRLLQQHHALAPEGRGPGAFGDWSTPPDGRTAARSDATGPKPGRGPKLLKVGKYLISAESRKVVALPFLLSWSSV